MGKSSFPREIIMLLMVGMLYTGGILMCMTPILVIFGKEDAALISLSISLGAFLVWVTALVFTDI